MGYEFDGQKMYVQAHFFSIVPSAYSESK